MKTKAEIFELLTAQAAATYRKKNHDYGDSFAKVRDKFPNSVLIRLNDKLSRLEVLMGGETAQVKGESIDDTLLDMANYCLMELTERVYEREAEAEKKRCVGRQSDKCNYLHRDRYCFGQKNTPVCTPNSGGCPKKHDV